MVIFLALLCFALSLVNLLLGMSEGAYHKKRLKEIGDFALCELTFSSQNFFFFHHALAQRLRRIEDFKYVSDDEVLDAMHLLQERDYVHIEEHTLGGFWPFRYLLTQRGKERCEAQDL